MKTDLFYINLAFIWRFRIIRAILFGSSLWITHYWAVSEQYNCLFLHFPLSNRQKHYLKEWYSPFVPLVLRTRAKQIKMSFRDANVHWKLNDNKINRPKDIWCPRPMAYNVWIYLEGDANDIKYNLKPLQLRSQSCES